MCYNNFNINKHKKTCMFYMYWFFPAKMLQLFVNLCLCCQHL